MNEIDKEPFPGAERCTCGRWKKPLFQSKKIQWCPSCEGINSDKPWARKYSVDDKEDSFDYGVSRFIYKRGG